MDEVKDNGCDCNFCKENRYWQKLINKYNFNDEEKEFIENIRNHKLHLEEDNIMFQAFFEFNKPDNIIRFLENKLKHLKNG